MKTYFWSRHTTYGILVGVLMALAFIVGCGGSSTPSAPTTGTVNTFISDPPSCSTFSHVYVTITKVTANINADAAPTDSGFQTLVDLTSSPKQVDLLSLNSMTCLLTELGSDTGLPPGKYQQIRLYLLANNATGATVTQIGSTTPANNCGSSPSTGPFNCVELSGSPAKQTLNLSSEAQTGIKIPSSQITSGGLTVTAGQAADLGIEFMSCESIVDEGNGQFRLKPVLHAGEVSLNTDAISGSVVDSASGKPIAGAVVFLEQPDSSGIDRVVMSGSTDSSGNFIFCPVPPGNYDVVADAMTGSGMSTTTYNATVTLKVGVGNSLKIPLVAESSAMVTVGTTTVTTTSNPGMIQGQVTSTSSTTTPPAAGSGVSADITLAALQPVGGTSTLIVTVPTFTGSTDNIATGASPMNSGSSTTCPSGTDCENYTLLVPASNPSVGSFASSGTTYASPAAQPALFWVNAQAFIPGSGSVTPNDCNPMSQPATFDSSDQLKIQQPPLTGSTVTQNFAFQGCTAPM